LITVNPHYAHSKGISQVQAAALETTVGCLTQTPKEINHKTEQHLVLCFVILHAINPHKQKSSD